jgi:hypothetical protein
MEVGQGPNVGCSAKGKQNEVYWRYVRNINLHRNIQIVSDYCMYDIQLCYYICGILLHFSLSID